MLRFDHVGITVANLDAATAFFETLGLEVEDIQATVHRATSDGYSLVGGIGEYEDIWKMAYIRGPEGIIVAAAERIG